MDFLFHVMAVSALVDDAGAGRHNNRFTIDWCARLVKNLCPLRPDNGKVKILEINDIAREMRQRGCIRSNKTGPITKAHRKR